jgi:CTP synthase
VIEFARDVVGIADATSEEMGEGSHVIAILPEQEDVVNLGGTMRLGDCSIDLKKGTRIADLYGTNPIVERHRHRYEVNPEYIPVLEETGLVFSGTCTNRMEVCELEDHPFFLATQFHPEFKSSPTHPSPPYLGFVAACRKNRITTQTR